VAIELWKLFAAAVAYLGLLFLIAYAADEGWLPRRLVRHPLTYALSLGVYATTWSFYGSVGFASTQGYLFLTIYLGVTAAFLLSPVLLAPLLRLVRDYQLTSLADLFAFRYPSRFTGVLVTLFMLAGLLPYISLQIQAVTKSVQILTQEAPPQVLALVFCVTITLFAVLFGARQLTPREKHEGLVVAIAFESLVKLVALLLVGGFAVHGVFGGFGGLERWLAAHPDAAADLMRPVQDGAWSTLLLLAFAAAFLLPRQFHMLFAENIEPASLRTASWAFPAFLLLLNLAIPPVLWAGQAQGLSVSPDYYVLAVAHREGAVLPTLFAYLGGISAASAMIIVESLALGAMCMNHLALPAWLALRRAPPADLYRWLLWGRRAVIALIIAAGYVTYVAVEHTQGLVQLGLISFVAVTQFLPAVVAMLAWPRATRVGFLAGVTAGMLVWFDTLLWPLLSTGTPDHALSLLYWLMPMPELERLEYATYWSLGANLALFALGSLLSRPSEQEVAADQACRLDAVLLVSRRPVAGNPAALQAHLEPALGAGAARREVQRGLDDLRIGWREKRARQMHFLQERVERNLSGLMGPHLARQLVGGLEAATPVARGRLVEEELERAQSRLSGLAAELNQLQLFHRRILQDLPIGVCSLGPQLDIVSWNTRLAEILGLDDVLGTAVGDLPAPWNTVLGGFARARETHRYKVQVQIGTRSRWLNLHKEVTGARRDGPATCVLLVEDLTDQRRLESEVAHSARLASIGTLASGVAHEIGNPLTGIACLAQNLRDEPDAADRDRALEEILTQTQRIGDILQSLLAFSRAEPETRAFARVDLGLIAEEAIRLVKLSRSGHDRRFENRVPREFWVEGDGPRLTQVLLNLLGNASDASTRGGRVELRASRGVGSITLLVQDWGSGMPESVRERVFEPFFTTKPAGRGTGLGLPLVYSIVADHGGSLAVDSRENDGTTVTVRLPVAPELATQAILT